MVFYKMHLTTIKNILIIPSPCFFKSSFSVMLLLVTFILFFFPFFFLSLVVLSFLSLSHLSYFAFIPPFVSFPVSVHSFFLTSHPLSLRFLLCFALFSTYILFLPLFFLSLLSQMKMIINFMTITHFSRCSKTGVQRLKTSY